MALSLRLLVPLLVVGTIQVAQAKHVVEIDRAHASCTMFESEKPLSRVVVSIPLDIVTFRDEDAVVIVFQHREVKVAMGSIDLTDAMKNRMLTLSQEATTRCAHDQTSPPRDASPDGETST